MAQPITWRNVAAPDATAAIKGMADANETLNSAFAKAQGTVDTMVRACSSRPCRCQGYEYTVHHAGSAGHYHEGAI
jgi:hypothetical protein